MSEHWPGATGGLVEYGQSRSLVITFWNRTSISDNDRCSRLLATHAHTVSKSSATITVDTSRSSVPDLRTKIAVQNLGPKRSNSQRRAITRFGKNRKAGRVDNLGFPRSLQDLHPPFKSGRPPLFSSEFANSLNEPDDRELDVRHADAARNAGARWRFGDPHRRQPARGVLWPRGCQSGCRPRRALSVRATSEGIW